jgi:ubiquitin carboxyl-terminal hydrolase 4/11/15
MVAGTTIMVRIGVPFVSTNADARTDSTATKRNNAQSAVTTAAYLLFYRRRSSKPLGGPFFEDFYEKLEVQNSFDDGGSQAQSRNSSPSSNSGEGQRLDGYSRINGSSSASRVAGAGHQTGDGGLEEDQEGESAGIPSTGIDYYDDELPSYQNYDPVDSSNDDFLMASTEANDLAPHLQTGWGFSNLKNIGKAANDDDASVGNSSTAVNEDEERFESAEWTMGSGDRKGTPVDNDIFDENVAKVSDTDDVAEIKIDEDAPSELPTA